MIHKAAFYRPELIIKIIPKKKKTEVLITRYAISVIVQPNKVNGGGNCVLYVGTGGARIVETSTGVNSGIKFQYQQIKGEKVVLGLVSHNLEGLVLSQLSIMKPSSNSQC